MATHPTPDYNKEIMKHDHGTVCLITDPASEHLMAAAAKRALKMKKEIKDSWTI